MQQPSALSAAERAFVRGGVVAGTRSDGRPRHGMRRLRVTTGELPHVHGSARASLGAGQTEVLVSVKAELVAVDAARPDEGRVECAAQVWASASDGVSGAGGTRAAGDVVAASLQRLLGARGAVDVRGLCVAPGRWCWCVYVDAVVLASAGSVCDVAAAAAVAALQSARLPRLALVPSRGGDAGAPPELALDDDPGAFTPFPRADALPVSVTVTRVAGVGVLDATGEEEACAEGSVAVGVDAAGRVCMLHSQGPCGVRPADVHEAIATALAVGPVLRRAIADAAGGGGNGGHGDGAMVFEPAAA